MKLKVYYSSETVFIHIQRKNGDKFMTKKKLLMKIKAVEFGTTPFENVPMAIIWMAVAEASIGILGNSAKQVNSLEISGNASKLREEILIVEPSGPTRMLQIGEMV